MKKDKGNLQQLVLGSCTVKFNLLAKVFISTFPDFSTDYGIGDEISSRY